jgi:putative SOS response-associated peptidase YedK
MCTNFIPAARFEFLEHWLGSMAPLSGEIAHRSHALRWPEETFPSYPAPILVGTERGAELRVAQFGLVPAWAKDAQHARELSRFTYNARSETAAIKPSFRQAWVSRQWALVPMESFFEPCWEDAATHAGRAVRWKISMADGGAFAVAGLWERWIDPVCAESIESFTLLTINADAHSLMNRMHRRGEEKRMPVIVSPESYSQWLAATPPQASKLMQAFPAELMRGKPAPLARQGTVPRSSPENLSLF